MPSLPACPASYKLLFAIRAHPPSLTFQPNQSSPARGEEFSPSQPKHPVPHVAGTSRSVASCQFRPTLGPSGDLVFTDNWQLTTDHGAKEAQNGSRNRTDEA